MLRGSREKGWINDSRGYLEMGWIAKSVAQGVHGHCCRDELACEIRLMAVLECRAHARAVFRCCVCVGLCLCGVIICYDSNV